MNFHQPMDYELIWNIDGNAHEFRLNGILIARVLSAKLEHDHFPTEVIISLRAMHGLTFAEARAIWGKQLRSFGCAREFLAWVGLHGKPSDGGQYLDQGVSD